MAKKLKPTQKEWEDLVVGNYLEKHNQLYGINEVVDEKIPTADLYLRHYLEGKLDDAADLYEQKLRYLKNGFVAIIYGGEVISSTLFYKELDNNFIKILSQWIIQFEEKANQNPRALTEYGQPYRPRQNF